MFWMSRPRSKMTHVARIVRDGSGSVSSYLQSDATSSSGCAATEVWKTASCAANVVGTAKDNAAAHAITRAHRISGIHGTSRDGCPVATTLPCYRRFAKLAECFGDV